MRQEAAEECEVNLKMLRNVVEGAEAAGCPLQHVFCMEGTKWYGQASPCCCSRLLLRVVLLPLAVGCCADRPYLI
jgi:hypothetical protein